MVAQAANAQFEITNQGNTNQCVTNVMMSGINTSSVSHIILDEQIVWFAADIANTSKTLTFQEDELSFSISPCMSVGGHIAKAVFQNGIIARQIVETNSLERAAQKLNSSSPALKQNAPVTAQSLSWGIRRTLIFLSKYAGSPVVYNYVARTISVSAANAVKRNAAVIARKALELARWQTVNLRIVEGQMANALIQSGVKATTARTI